MLADLATDSAISVRLEVARNSNTSAATLAGLATDPDNDVRLVVAENPNTQAETLTDMAATKQSISVLKAIESNPNTPDATRKKLRKKLY